MTSRPPLERRPTPENEVYYDGKDTIHEFLTFKGKTPLDDKWMTIRQHNTAPTGSYVRLDRTAQSQPPPDEFPPTPPDSKIVSPPTRVIYPGYRPQRSGRPDTPVAMHVVPAPTTQPARHHEIQPSGPQMLSGPQMHQRDIVHHQQQQQQFAQMPGLPPPIQGFPPPMHNFAPPMHNFAPPMQNFAPPIQGLPPPMHTLDPGYYHPENPPGNANSQMLWDKMTGQGPFRPETPITRSASRRKPQPAQRRQVVQRRRSASSLYSSSSSWDSQDDQVTPRVATRFHGPPSNLDSAATPRRNDDPKNAPRGGDSLFSRNPRGDVIVPYSPDGGGGGGEAIIRKPPRSDRTSSVSSDWSIPKDPKVAKWVHSGGVDPDESASQHPGKVAGGTFSQTSERNGNPIRTFETQNHPDVASLVMKTQIRVKNQVSKHELIEFLVEFPGRSGSALYLEWNEDRINKSSRDGEPLGPVLHAINTNYIPYTALSAAKKMMKSNNHDGVLTKLDPRRFPGGKRKGLLKRAATLVMKKGKEDKGNDATGAPTSDPPIAQPAKPKQTRPKTLTKPTPPQPPPSSASVVPAKTPASKELIPIKSAMKQGVPVRPPRPADTQSLVSTNTATTALSRREIRAATRAQQNGGNPRGTGSSLAGKGAELPVRSRKIA